MRLLDHTFNQGHLGHVLPIPLMFRLLLLSCLLLGLPSRYAWLPTAAAQTPDKQNIPVAQLPELLEGGGEAAIVAAIQQALVLPFGTPMPAQSSEVVVRFVVGTLGEVAEEEIVHGLSPAVDEAVLAAVRTLPEFRAVQRAGKYVRVPCTLTIRAPGVATPAQRREATTRWQRIAQRQPNEADSTFVRRVLPLSYDQKLVAYAWRPSLFGKQLFFSRRGGEDNEGGTDLFVLDPYQANTYAVQVLPIDSMGDLTDLAALFFADANQDGRKDLLALSQCDLREQVRLSDGELQTGRIAHYQTLIWQYGSPDKTGRPHYEQDAERPDLDDLPTAAAVRQALVRHPRHPAPSKATVKPARTVK
jgi:hypothetical protein